MNSADSRGKNNKYMSKPKISREKSYAYNVDDIIKNENIMNAQKEEREKFRNHNLKVASGEIDNNEKASEEAINVSKKEKKDKKGKKEKKTTEKKAPDETPDGNITIQNHYDLPDSDNEDN